MSLTPIKISWFFRKGCFFGGFRLDSGTWLQHIKGRRNPPNPQKHDKKKLSWPQHKVPKCKVAKTSGCNNLDSMRVFWWCCAQLGGFKIGADTPQSFLYSTKMNRNTHSASTHSSWVHEFQISRILSICLYLGLFILHLFSSCFPHFHRDYFTHRPPYVMSRPCPQCLVVPTWVVHTPKLPKGPPCLETK